MHQLNHVISNAIENYRTRTLILDQSVAGQPGQFVMVWLPGIGEKPYCITNNQPLTLTVVSVGPFSSALNALSKGDKIWIRGPFGNGYRLMGEKLMLVGGGYGVASLFFLAQQALGHHRQVEVCIGAAAARDVLLAEKFEAAGIRTQIATEDGSTGTTGKVTDLLDGMIAESHPDWLYACGPVGMLKAVSNLCHTHQLPHQLSWEAHIRCGMGLCGACECTEQGLELPPGWLVCQDGPVQIVDFEKPQTGRRPGLGFG